MERGQYDLSYWIQMQNYPISENIIKNLAFQILVGLSEVHRKGIIHRDLKPSNLIIRDNGLLAICDFGSAV
jgi:serine/threonine protein kinase